MYRISVAAYSGDPGEDLIEASRRFIERLYKLLGDSVILYLGGYYGLMKHVADEACRHGIRSVFILPYSIYDVPRDRCFIPVKTGMELRERSEILVLSGDVLVALGGYSGTIIEILMAYANNKRSYVLTGYSMPSDSLERVFSPYVDPRRNTIIRYYYRDPVRLAEDLADDLRRVYG